MLTCKDVNQFLVDYFDGNLDPGADERFNEHVARCSQCNEYLDQYRTTISEVRSVAGAELPKIPDQLVEHTLSFLREHYGDQSTE